MILANIKNLERLPQIFLILKWNMQTYDPLFINYKFGKIRLIFLILKGNM